MVVLGEPTDRDNKMITYFYNQKPYLGLNIVSVELILILRNLNYPDWSNKLKLGFKQLSMNLNIDLLS